MTPNRSKKLLILFTSLGLLLGCSLDPKLQDLKINVTVSEQPSGASKSRDPLSVRHCCNFDINNIPLPYHAINKTQTPAFVSCSFPNTMVAGQVFTLRVVCYKYSSIAPEAPFTDQSCADTAPSGAIEQSKKVVDTFRTFEPNKDYDFVAEP